MDVVGSEIGQKMRSAIKAKLTELGCYVDDELPDYVMVMVANKRTRAQMEDDLQLFLGDNTELFVNWLHQVLKKLQEVTVAAPKPPEPDKSKEKEKSHSKEKKSKEKKSKDKSKKSELKKAKKKDKEKEKNLRKKEQKKAHKKKKSKDQEMIRPNIPPLLMNMEKDSEPSITDVFAGQILKNHGILIESIKEDPKETKPVLQIPEAKRPILPIIDPASILATPSENSDLTITEESGTSVSSGTAPRDEQLKEMNEIEAKIQGLRQKLAEQLDSMSEDEDFLNIRTEAEELMNDFAEDVFQEISEQTPVVPTPPLAPKSPTPPPLSPKPVEIPKDPIETLPQIELKLPKRPIRERLGAREEQRKPPEKQKEDRRPSKSPESFTPERELEPSRTSGKSAKSRIGPVDQKRKSSEVSSEKTESSSKRLTSRVSVLENRSSGRSTCASVVRVRPRPRVGAPASSLLLRAVADAHKSLFNLPPKVMRDQTAVKRALVLPMRRVDSQSVYLSMGDRQEDTDVHDAISLGDPDSDDDKSSKLTSDNEKDEYVPTSLGKMKPNEYGPLPLIKKSQDEYAPGLTMKIQNTEYVPSRRLEGRTASRKDDSIVIEAINIHNPTVGKDKNTQFIVTMDGFNPNAFLAKKLQTEGILNEDDEEKSKPSETNKQEDVISPTDNEPPKTSRAEATKEKLEKKRRLSDVSEKSYTSEKSKASDKADACNVIEIAAPQVIVKEEKVEMRKSESSVKDESPPVKKRKSSPIVFDVGKKEKDKEQMRERTESVGSDNHVTVTTTVSSHKYDTLPPLSTTSEKKQVWCRSFPQCRYGSSCVFVHPRCKFAAGCTRRSCPYSHSPATAPPSPAPVIASHVVPAANYKSISAAPLPAMCKYYPSCANPTCHFYHPKPCRYGKMCGNKLECNFYHADVPTSKWRYSVT